jgi:hypothetical protein
MPLLRVSAQFFGALADHLDGPWRLVRARDPPVLCLVTRGAT